MSSLLVGLLILIGFFFLLVAGLPVAFAAGASGIIYCFIVLGPPGLSIALLSVYNTMNSFVLIAIPFFIFMAAILQHSGIAEELYDSMSEWAGNVKGGLAMATVVVCTIFAAMSGVIGAAIVTMSLVALPSMLDRGYSKHLAMGSIMASGSLAMLIPPSILFILYGTVAGESIGQLYLGGLVPGILLSGLYILYIGVRCSLQPTIAPAKVKHISFASKLRSLRSAIGPVIIIAMVLGSMFLGMATASEAAALGAIGALIIAGIRRKLTVRMLKEASYQTAKASAMVAWIVVGAGFFSQVFTLAGTVAALQRLLSEAGLHPWTILVMMQVVIFVAGCLIDDVAIIMLFAPLFVAILKAVTTFDLLWFGVVFNINLQLSLLTPPFGFALFYMRGMAPSGTNMGDVYRSAIPFIIIQGIVLLLALAYPGMCTWLPRKVFS